VTELVDLPAVIDGDDDATEITLVVPEGESTKDVEALLRARVGSSAPESKSGKARELILDILENEGEQESDAFDARIANETGLERRADRPHVWAHASGVGGLSARAARQLRRIVCPASGPRAGGRLKRENPA
jgi:hypothetical protein